MIGVYRIYGEIKSYIGSSICIEDRIFHHFYLLKRNKSHSPKLQAAYNKHGEHYFKHEILEICTKEELPLCEKKWIHYFDSVIHGYNCSDDTTCATRGYKWNEASRLKASLNQKALMSTLERKKISSEIIINYNKSRKGIPKSKSHREKISIANRGETFSATTKVKMSISGKGKGRGKYWLGKKRSVEDKEKMRQSHMGKLNTGTSKSIIQFDLKGNKISQYLSTADCVRKNDSFKRSGIKECLNGRNKTYKKFIFRYASLQL